MDISKQQRDQLVDAISNVLERVCERNDRFISTINILTRFHVLREQDITIHSFLRRIAVTWSCSQESLVIALIYMDRLIQEDRCFMVNSLSIHRVIITSILLAVKFVEDSIRKNAYYGEVMYVTDKELNMLEIDFLFRIKFNLWIQKSLYDDYNNRLRPQRAIAGGFKKSRNEFKPDRYLETELWEDEQAPKPASQAPVLWPEETKEQHTDQESYNATQQTEVHLNLAIEQSMMRLSFAAAANNENHHASGFAQSGNSTMENSQSDQPTPKCS